MHFECNMSNAGKHKLHFVIYKRPERTFARLYRMYANLLLRQPRDVGRRGKMRQRPFYRVLQQGHLRQV